MFLTYSYLLLLFENNSQGGIMPEITRDEWKRFQGILISLSQRVKRYVLTGGPGCGKTTTLIALERYGEMVVREAAADYIERQRSIGVKSPVADPSFEKQVLLLQLHREVTSPVTSRIFFDRGLLDALAYYQHRHRRLDGLMNDIIQTMTEYPLYKIVFLLEHIGEITDHGLREESLSEALALERLQRHNYRMTGYRVIRIPVGSIKERVQKILSYCD